MIGSLRTLRRLAAALDHKLALGVNAARLGPAHRGRGALARAGGGSHLNGPGKHPNVVDLARRAGDVVAVPLGALARWRSGKPMHPRGAVFDAELERWGSTPALGVPWSDQPGEDRAVVRLSRGAGLPAALPDLLGLAVRLPDGDGPIDLLLSSAGLGRLTRFVPVPRRNAACGYSSLMGYRSDAGTIRLAARPQRVVVPSEPRAQAADIAGRPLRFFLAAAPGLRPWRVFGRLTLTAPAEPLDPDVRFDAVQHPPPGLVADGPMARFRAPAYAAARSARS